MSVRQVAAAARSTVLVLSLTACAGGGPLAGTLVGGEDDLVVGVSGDLPGLSAARGDGFVGLDVDLAGYVARGLGWDERDVRYEIVPPGDRERALVEGEVDLVVAAYSITDERERSVDFAGPYLVAGQDLLVAEDSTVTGPRGLDGLEVCGAQGSAGLARVVEDAYSPGAVVREELDTAACVGLLLAGEVDAVTDDDVVLAGHAQQHPDDVKVVGTPFTSEYYGIGLPEGSPDVAVVDDLLARAVDDGTWQAALDEHLGRSGWTTPLPPVPGRTP